MAKKTTNKKHVSLSSITSRSLWRSRKESWMENRYEVGQKVHARSTLASNFNVSPETARKAINVWSMLGIMDVPSWERRVICASKEKAQSFLDQYKDVQSIQEIRKDILESVERQQQELV